MAHTEKGIKRQEKLEHRRKREQYVAEVLAKHNQKKEKKRRTKRKTYEEVKERIHPGLWRPHLFVRRPQDWKSPTYNEERQFCDFARHLYCRYDMPYFLLRIFYNKPSKRRVYRQRVDLENNSQLFQEWFFQVATGKSFAKENRDFFTKKEAHIFLSAPAKNNIPQNFWYAKCLAVEASPRLTTFFVGRFGASPNIIWDEFFYDAVKFFTRFQDEIHLPTLNDVMDFVFNRHANDTDFKLKDRTYASLIKASNDWHRDMHFKKFGDKNYSWDPLPLKKWIWKDKVEKCDWFVEQLTTSKELYAEGRRMRHCVASYADACRRGRSYIFSVKSHDGINVPESVITVEVNESRQVVQARGKLNRSPSGRADMALRKWMGDNGLSYYGWRW